MSIILAKILGLYFLAIGIAFFTNFDRLKKGFNQIMTDEGFLFYGGLLALLIGAFIVSVHNFWVMRWPVVITILGWWSLIKGFGLLIYPNFNNLFSFFLNRSKGFYLGLGAIYTLIGLFLAYHGWK